jgi:hypothetical protein
VVARQIVGDGKDRSGYRNDCFLHAATGSDSDKLGVEIVVRVACGRPRELHSTVLSQEAPWRRRRHMTGTLEELRTQPGPRPQVPYRRKPAHSDADLRDDHVRGRRSIAGLDRGERPWKRPRDTRRLQLRRIGFFGPSEQLRGDKSFAAAWKFLGRSAPSELIYIAKKAPTSPTAMSRSWSAISNLWGDRRASPP